LTIDTNEEEQIEALKRWWNDNGSSLLIGVGLVFALMFGVQRWQASQSGTAGAAADMYEQIANMAVANVAKTITDDDLLAAQGVYSQLKSQYASSIYTRYAALVMAKFNADRNNLEQAATELQWVLDNQSLGFMQKAEPELFDIARARLARIRLAQGQAQAALDLLRAAPNASFVVSQAEIEGDALLQLGDKAGAIAAYQKALTASTEGNPALLRLKLQDLGVSTLEAQQ
jgi:predicted negative regulator of RcsB-dependent stress response